VSTEYKLTLCDLLKRVGAAYEAAAGAQGWATVATRRAILGTDSERDAHACRVAADAALWAADEAADRARLARVCTFSSVRAQAHIKLALAAVDQAFTQAQAARSHAERERLSKEPA
jgi:hypothetical protein